MTDNDEPTINQVFAEFRAELRDNLSERTFRGYRSALQLLGHCIDGYGPNHLTNPDRERWEEARDTKDPPRFSEVFGPEYIPRLFGEFLSYFMPRKVQPSKTLAKNAEKTVRKLRKWLVANDYVDQSPSEPPRRSSNLVDATELRTMLEDVTIGGSESNYPDFDEGHFYIREVLDDTITVERVVQPGTIEISLPPEITEKCTENMAISGVIVRNDDTWCFLEVWNVYP